MEALLGFHMIALPICSEYEPFRKEMESDAAE